MTRRLPIKGQLATRIAGSGVANAVAHIGHTSCSQAFAIFNV